jgi:hypothetical protein
MNTPAKYILPDFLQGVISLDVYKNWLDHRADEIYMRDRKRKCPYALNGSKQLYKEAIHQAVLGNGRTDPFTGDILRWDLIGKWVNSGKDLADLSDEQRREFALLPTVDHIDPASEAPEFEICSFEINKCKSDLDPVEFVELCKRIVNFYKGINGIKKAVVKDFNR